MNLNRRLSRLAGDYAARTMRDGGADVEAIRRRTRREKECARQNLRMCWDCERGFDKSLLACPHCGAEVIPF